MSETEAKNDLRRQIRERLRALGPEVRAEASLRICREAADHPVFREGRCLALFAPLPLEPDIHPLIEEAWAEKKRVALPLMLKNPARPAMDWHEIKGWGDVATIGPMRLREPDPFCCPRVAPGEIDGVFVPGLAFDGDGHRLGRGGGYYDVFLAQMRGTLPCLGLFFAAQKVDHVPREIHDQRLTMAITEDGLMRF